MTKEINWIDLNDCEPEEEVEVMLKYRPYDYSDEVEYETAYRFGMIYYSAITDNMIEGTLLGWTTIREVIEALKEQDKR